MLVDVGKVAGVKRVLIVHVTSQSGTFWPDLDCFCRNEQPSLLAAAHRRHDELLSPAAALGNFRTIAKLEILGKTQAHFGQSFGIAVDRHRARR